MTEDERVDRCVREPKPASATKVRVRRHTSCEKLQLIVQRYDEALFIFKAGRSTPRLVLEALALTMSWTLTLPVSCKSLSKLTPEERVECIAEGRCFKCRKPGRTIKTFLDRSLTVFADVGLAEEKN